MSNQGKHGSLKSSLLEGGAATMDREEEVALGEAAGDGPDGRPEFGQSTDRRLPGWRRNFRVIPGGACGGAQGMAKLTEHKSIKVMKRQKTGGEALSGGAPAGNGGWDRTGLDKEGQRHLGRRLKAIYDEVLSAPVPQKFLDLLDQIEAKRREKTGR